MMLSTIYPEVPSIPETGYYGEQTREAVLALQRILGLPQTGNVNPEAFFQIEVAANQV